MLDLVLDVATLVLAKIALTHHMVCKQLAADGDHLVTDWLSFLCAARLRTSPAQFFAELEHLRLHGLQHKLAATRWMPMQSTRVGALLP